MCGYPRDPRDLAICRSSARTVRLAGDMKPECAKRGSAPACRQSCVVGGLSWENSFTRGKVLQAPVHAVAKEFRQECRNDGLLRDGPIRRNYRGAVSSNRHNSGTRIIPATEPGGACFPGNLALADTCVAE